MVVVSRRRSSIAYFLLSAALSLWPAEGPAADDTVRMGLSSRIIASLPERLGINVDDGTLTRDTCPPLETEKIANTGRPVVEVVVLCNALFEAGLAERIELVGGFPHKRMLTEITHGTIDVSGTTVFPEVLETLATETRPRLSKPLIRVNEFEKVIYTMAHRKDLLAVRTLDELRQFKAVVVKYWAIDAKTLKSMGLEGVAEVSKQELYKKFLAVGRADFAIASFLSETHNPVFKDMVPIPGIKLALVSPRVFPVSPGRADIQAAIDGFIGKARKREGGGIVQAFLRAGFFHEELAGWRRVFPVGGGQ